jgi:hypothetical protein
MIHIFLATTVMLLAVKWNDDVHNDDMQIRVSISDVLIEEEILLKTQRTKSYCHYVVCRV